MNDKYKSRKLLLVISIMIIGTFALFFKYLTGGEFNVLMIATVGSYITGNIAEKKLL